MGNIDTERMKQLQDRVYNNPLAMLMPYLTFNAVGSRRRPYYDANFILTGYNDSSSFSRLLELVDQQVNVMSQIFGSHRNAQFLISDREYSSAVEDKAFRELTNSDDSHNIAGKKTAIRFYQVSRLQYDAFEKFGGEINRLLKLHRTNDSFAEEVERIIGQIFYSPNEFYDTARGASFSSDFRYLDISTRDLDAYIEDEAKSHAQLMFKTRNTPPKPPTLPNQEDYSDDNEYNQAMDAYEKALNYYNRVTKKDYDKRDKKTELQYYEEEKHRLTEQLQKARESGLVDRFYELEMQKLELWNSILTEFHEHAPPEAKKVLSYFAQEAKRDKPRTAREVCQFISKQNEHLRPLALAYLINQQKIKVERPIASEPVLGDGLTNQPEIIVGEISPSIEEAPNNGNNSDSPNTPTWTERVSDGNPKLGEGLDKPANDDKSGQKKNPLNTESKNQSGNTFLKVGGVAIGSIMLLDGIRRIFDNKTSLLDKVVALAESILGAGGALLIATHRDSQKLDDIFNNRSTSSKVV